MRTDEPAGRWRTAIGSGVAMPIVLAGLCLLAAVAEAFGQAEAGARTYVNRRVADVLQELQTPEIRIIFSSELVPLTLRVKAEPRAADTQTLARQILAPHGLTLQAGPGGTFVVVIAPRARPAPPRRSPAAAKGPETPQAPPPEVMPDASASRLRLEEHIDVTNRPGVVTSTPGVYAVESRTLRETAGGLENVLQLLPLLPGAAATNDDDGKVAVRGAGPEHNLVLFDGVAIHTPQRYGGLTTSFVNPATVANVSLDASGLEAQTGGRLSSVVTLDTRDGRADRRLAVSGSAGLTSGDLLAEGRLPGSDSGSWWATWRGTYYRPVASRVGFGPLPGFSDVQVKVAFAPSARTRLSIFGLEGRETLRSFDRDPDAASLASDRLHGNHRIVAANLRWTPGPRVTAVTTASAYSSRARSEERLGTAPAATFDRRTRVLDLALRHRVVSAPSRRHALDAGVELHRVSSAWQMTGVKRESWWRGVGPTVWGEMVEYPAGPIDSRLRRTQTGLWLQDRLTLGSRLTIEPGVRVDWNSFTREAAWQPRLRVTTRAGALAIWAGLSAQAQTPSHEGLQGSQYLDLTGDRTDALRNERSRQAAVGVERPLGRGVSLRAEAYHRQFDRLLVQQPETEAARALRLARYVIPTDLPLDSPVLEYRPSVHPASTGRGEATGLELLLQRSGARVSGWVGYARSRSTRELHGRTVPFDFDRPHAFNAAATLRLTRRVRAAATWQWASGFPTTPVYEEVVFATRPRPDGSSDGLLYPWRDGSGRFYTMIGPSGPRRLSTVNTARLTRYTRTDVRVTYATGGRWEFYGEIINLFDERNYSQRIPAGGPLAGNNVYPLLSRVPSFGIRALF